MLQFDKIKLVAWDLDDTFWKGIISEEEIQPIAENIQLVHDLTDCGIMNTICTKNDRSVVEQKLRDLGVWDEFVFVSVNWYNKAQRLKQTIDQMGLRPDNVLFLDDVHFNRQEALHVMPTIMVFDPKDALPELFSKVAASDKKDVTHNRLAQYKVLEKKVASSLAYSTSEEFLYATQIHVEITLCSADMDDIMLGRLHELVMRTNQLNYTKRRCSIDELKNLIHNESFQCGYTHVWDKFGDYGIVGFYALNMESNTLEHFLFSCRTMGQKIEQWVYAQLGYPNLQVVGEVRTALNNEEIPGWINQSDKSINVFQKSNPVNVSEQVNILLKAPCDLSNAQMYIQGANQFDAEFTYITDDGRSIETYNHSIHIAGQKEYSQQDKVAITQDCIFVDPHMLEPGLLYKNTYNVVFISTLFETDYAIYRKKGTNIRVVWGGIRFPITQSENWDKLINEEIYTGGNHFTREWLKQFAAQYEFLGETTPEDYEVFIRKLLKWLPDKTKFCFILGATQIYDKEPSKATHHKLINDVVIRLSQESNRICYIAIDDCIHDISDFTDGLNHYQTKVYYEIAQKMIEVINRSTGYSMKVKSGVIARAISILHRLRSTIKQIIRQDNMVYLLLKKGYLLLTGKRDNQCVK